MITIDGVCVLAVGRRAPCIMAHVKVFEEFARLKSYHSIQQVDSSDVKILWAQDFWDGPRSGMLSWRGGEYWFEVIEESTDPDLKSWYRRFAIVQLTDEQHAEHARRHALFVEKVDGGRQPREIWDQYYSVAKTWPRIGLATNHVVAWFQI